MKEKDLPQHALMGEGQRIIPRPKQAPSILLKHHDLLQKIEQSGDPGLERLSSAERKAIKQGEKVYRIFDEILSGGIAVLNSTKSRRDSLQSSGRFIEDQISNLPRETARAVRYLMDSKGWDELRAAQILKWSEH